MLNSLNFLSRRLYAPSRRVFQTQRCIFRPNLRFLTTSSPIKQLSFDDERDKWKSGVRDLLDPIEHYLKHGQDGLATSHFLERIRTIKFNNKELFRIYEHVVSLFLRYNKVLFAAIVYSHMTAWGFIPSVSLRTQMRFIKLAEASPDEFSVLQELKVAFQQRPFEEAHLRDLLNLLANTMQCSPEFIDRVVRTFLGTRDPNHKLNSATVSLLVRIHTTAGSIAKAQNWIADHTPASPQPHTDLLKTLTSADPANTEAYKWIMQHMKANNIQADLAFYNATLSLWVSHERLEPVFKLYHNLRQSGQLVLTPDAYTFGILFGALRKVLWDREQRRRVLRRRAKLPANALSSRALFHEMIACHLKHTDGRMMLPSPVLTPAVLDQALRVFMLEEDFAAAFVVVRFLRTLKFGPSLATYQIVVLRLLERIRRELKLIHEAEEPERYWTYRFLGLETYRSPQGNVPPERSIFEMVLRLATVPRLSLDYIPPQPPAEESAEEQGGEVEVKNRSDPMPSISVFLKLESPPPNTVWSTVPLERILRRAILAKRSIIASSSAGEVAAELVEARAEMFPPLTQKERARKYRYGHGPGPQS